MKKLILIASSLSVTFLLASCGGGGGDDGPAGTTTTPPTSVFVAGAAKYSGTWIGCNSTGTTTSRKETLVFSIQSENVATVTSTDTDYAAGACAGPAGRMATDAVTVTFTGTKTIGSDTVDKVTVAQVGSPAGKQVLTVKGTPAVLFFGREIDEGGTLDAEGFPNTLHPAGLTKQ